MVRTNGLTYQYPNSNLIQFPDLEVEAGHGLVIYGESGCGKTTLLHMLGGLLQPKSGHITVGEKSITALTPREMDQFRGENIGIVYQQFYFIESLSIRDNLLISPFKENNSKARKIIERLNLEDIISKYPHQISSGQKQRACIARAVMSSPKVILADEPTSNLDNKNCSYVIDLLMEEAFWHDAALIVVTHDDRLRTEISDSIDLANHSKVH